MGGPVCLALASLDTDLQRSAGAWEGLPTHIRKIILALVGLQDEFLVGHHASFQGFAAQVGMD
jgi:hypothetical protein